MASQFESWLANSLRAFELVISCKAKMSTFKESIIGASNSIVESILGKFSIFQEIISKVSSVP